MYVPLKVIYIDCLPVALFVDRDWVYTVVLTRSNLENFVKNLMSDRQTDPIAGEPEFAYWHEFITKIENAVYDTTKSDVMSHVKFTLRQQRFTDRTKAIFCKAAGTTLSETFPEYSGNSGVK